VFSFLRSVVFLGIIFWSTNAALADPGPPRNVRPLDPWASETMARGLDRSALVRDLVAVLETSDTIVHIETTTTMPENIGGMTRLIVGAGDERHRYVRVSLYRDLLPNERAATLAHELQHACEIAESTARTSEGVLALFHRIGRRVGGAKGYFETTEAQRAGARAWIELRTGRAAAVAATQDR
jgi:hypothetical protein